MILIDPPSPFADLDEWASFADEMEKLEKDHPEAREWLEVARDKIAELTLPTK